MFIPVSSQVKNNNDELINSPSAISNAFNECFKNIPPLLADNIPTSLQKISYELFAYELTLGTSKCILLRPITLDDVLAHLTNYS